MSYFSESMRRSARWMTIWDDRILEFVQENESGSPTKLRDGAEIPVTPTQIGRRCQVLADYGLLKHLGNAVYVLTEEGERYLEGELNAQELSADQPGNTPRATA